jgi:hypothetical protein
LADALAEKKALLGRWLQTAIELELATIPPYLIALLSIKLPGNREAAELIRGVMIEEMLHLALVGNVLNAIGGKPRIDESVVPRYPLTLTFEGKTFRDRQFPINLEAFSGAAIETFMKIEQPEQPRRFTTLWVEELHVPALTIGEFYHRILDVLVELDRDFPGGLFTADPKRQLHKDYYWSSGGEIIAVSDLASATAALKIVIAQGEGAWPKADGNAAAFTPEFDMGHYFRFSEIFHGCRYQRTDDPAGPPSGPRIAVDYGAVYPVKKNPDGKDYADGSALKKLNDAFNDRYTTMLMQLHEALNGTPQALYTAIMNGMHGLTPIAHDMMKLPLGGDPEAVGCPTFAWHLPDAE